MAKNDKTLNNVELKQMVTDIILELRESIRWRIKSIILRGICRTLRRILKILKFA